MQGDLMLLEDVFDVLKSLAHSYPDGKLCWCEKAIGNPMMKDHSASCLQARKLLDEHPYYK